MDRLLVVRHPGLLAEDESGAVLRTFVRVVEAVEAYCPWVTAVRPGLCSLPARGPARYFGGESTLVELVADAVDHAVADTPEATGRPEVGMADGLFAAVLAARAGVIVPAGGTAAFLAPFPTGALVDPARGDPSLPELLARLGISTLGAFAALPEAHVLGRFGSGGVTAHRVAAGRCEDPGWLRVPATGRRVDELRHGTATAAMADAPAPPRQPGFWGGVSDTDARAARALTSVQQLLGPDGVVTARRQGGRGPVGQARIVTWGAHQAAGPWVGALGGSTGAPWPGRIPPPAPALVHLVPRRAELAGAQGEPVHVSGRGLLSEAPARLSVDGHRWTAVTAWAGPWLSDERWWSRSRRRSAHMQVVTGGTARLLRAERGRWWVEATYG